MDNFELINNCDNEFLDGIVIQNPDLSEIQEAFEIFLSENLDIFQCIKNRFKEEI